MQLLCRMLIEFARCLAIVLSPRGKSLAGDRMCRFRHTPLGVTEDADDLGVCSSCGA
jgi:hypothetical protein